MKIAAIDIGTNSFLCLIAEMSSNGSIVALHDEVEIVRLGQDVNRTKMFQAQALDRAQKTLRRFRESIDRFKPEKIKAVATSAARDAQNTDELKKIFLNYQIPLEIIDGAKEAELTFFGALSGAGDSSYKAVIDIGGGSTEVIFGDSTRLDFAKSIDIGAVRVTEMFFKGAPPASEEFLRALHYIKEQFEKNYPKEGFQNLSQMIAVAGTPTELVSAKVGGYNPKKIDNYILDKTELDDWITKLKNADLETRIKTFGISPGRADVILAGTMILREALEYFSLPAFSVSTRGLRFGLAKEMLLELD